jgi:hypothetical protein
VAGRKTWHAWVDGLRKEPRDAMDGIHPSATCLGGLLTWGSVVPAFPPPGSSSLPTSLRASSPLPLQLPLALSPRPQAPMIPRRSAHIRRRCIACFNLHARQPRQAWSDLQPTQPAHIARHSHRRRRSPCGCARPPAATSRLAHFAPWASKRARRCPWRTLGLQATDDFACAPRVRRASR